MKTLSLGYLVFLTMLLLTERPERLIGMGAGLPEVLDLLLPVAHLLSFLVLSVLAFASRWPMPLWCIVGLLSLYGGATELVQGLVPGRTPDWLDWLQDAGGIVAGLVVCWVASRTWRVFAPARPESGLTKPAGLSDGEPT